MLSAIHSLTLHNSQIKRSPKVLQLPICALYACVCTAGGVDYQSDVHNVAVEAEASSAEVSIAVFNDSIVEGNETFTADLSVPAAEAALGVSVSATDGTAYVEIQDNGTFVCFLFSLLFVAYSTWVMHLSGVLMFSVFL